MTWVLFFSFGVERGRHLALKAPEAVALELPSPEAVPETTRTETIAITAETTRILEEPAPVAPALDSEILQVPVEKVLTDENLFTIQVASYKYDSAAQREAKRLAESGYEIFVLDKGNYSIVCVGKFGDKGQAQEFSKKLKSKYTDLLVRRF